MIVSLMFKTPDVVDYAIEGLDEDQALEIKEKLKKWIKYGEIIKLEYNTETDEFKVVR